MTPAIFRNAQNCTSGKRKPLNGSLPTPRKTRHALFAVQRLGPIVQLGEAQIRCHEFEKTGQLAVEGEVFPCHFYTSLAPIRQKPGPRLMHEPGFSTG